ncbi:MAG: MarR family transcriptional regulator [Deltaproteobacteria bacterium]|nr:MarR family transcriptional regulator [Deltaproteobacteria bacterium]
MSIDADQAVAFLELFGNVKRTMFLVGWRALSDLGLGPTQMRLMRQLAKAGPQAQTDLARTTATDPSATSRALRSLTAMGWIRSVRGELDKRESLIMLTAVGEKALPPIERAYRKMARDITRELDAKDVAAFERLAMKLLRLADEPAPLPRKKRPQTW